MPRCDHCKRKTSVVLPCQFCAAHVCPRCVTPESHLCANMNDCVALEIGELKAALMSAKARERPPMDI